MAKWIKRIFTKENIKNNVTSTTGSLLTVLPTYATIETLVYGMDVNNSFYARLASVALGYAGFGIIYKSLRKRSRHFFKVDKEDVSEKKKIAHDIAYNVAWGLLANTLVYTASHFVSGTSLDKILVGVPASSLVSIGLGPLSGYSLDTFLDFTGAERSDRKMPYNIKNAPRKVKRWLAAGMVAASILTTAGSYGIKQKFFPNTTIQQEVFRSLTQKSGK